MASQRWSTLALVCFISLSGAQAQLVPTTPGPNETYAAGSACTIAWNTDTSGTWKNVSIDLMSGSNNNMSLVTNVITSMDGTDDSLTPYKWTCPEVDPYSNIYFYQFTNGDDITTRAWTTRFTITSPANETVPPPNAQQPNGDAVPWGIGTLVSKVSGAIPPTHNASSSSLGNSTSATIVDDPEETDRRHKHQGDGHDSEDSGDDEDGSRDRGSERSHSDDSESKESESSSKTRIQTARISDALIAASRASYIEHHTQSPSGTGDDDAMKEQQTGAVEVPSSRDSSCQCGYALQSDAGSLYSVVSASAVLAVSLFVAFAV